MSDEDRWAVPAGRRPALASHNTQVRNNGRDDAILYYPGSGADVLYPLFAAGAKARYFVFVDPLDLSISMPGAIKETHSLLNSAESAPILRNLNIASRPANTWMFSMQRRTRYLFHFRTGHDSFIAANRGFVCDIAFEKDFWESEDVIDLSDVLAILRVGGHYSTNASLGNFSSALSLVGLDFVDSYQINGDQFLYRRRTATRLNWNDLNTALDEGVQVVKDLIADDTNALSYDGPYDPVAIGAELTLRRAAMLQPFANRGINVPLPLQRPLCRQMAIKAVGGGLIAYVGGIHNAFG